MSFFYQGVEDGEPIQVAPRQRMCLELARNFTHISNERHQMALSSLARALVED